MLGIIWSPPSATITCQLHCHLYIWWTDGVGGTNLFGKVFKGTTHVESMYKSRSYRDNLFCAFTIRIIGATPNLKFSINLHGPQRKKDGRERGTCNPVRKAKDRIDRIIRLRFLSSFSSGIPCIEEGKFLRASGSNSHCLSTGFSTRMSTGSPPMRWKDDVFVDASVERASVLYESGPGLWRAESNYPCIPVQVEKSSRLVLSVCYLVNTISPL